jgi:predicted RNA-binding Zn-ribbon protein involved in translation (DUF1610 family)
VKLRREQSLHRISIGFPQFLTLFFMTVRTWLCGTQNRPLLFNFNEFPYPRRRYYATLRPKMLQVFHRCPDEPTIRESPLKYLILGWGPGRGPVCRHRFPPRARCFRPGALAAADGVSGSLPLCPHCGEVMAVVSYNEFETSLECPACGTEVAIGFNAERARALSWTSNLRYAAANPWRYVYPGRMVAAA